MISCVNDAVGATRPAPVPGNLEESASTVTRSLISAMARLMGTWAIVVSRRSPLSAMPLTPTNAWSACSIRRLSAVSGPDTER